MDHTDHHVRAYACGEEFDRFIFPQGEADRDVRLSCLHLDFDSLFRVWEADRRPAGADGLEVEAVFDRLRDGAHPVADDFGVDLPDGLVSGRYRGLSRTAGGRKGEEGDDSDVFFQDVPFIVPPWRDAWFRS